LSKALLLFVGCDVVILVKKSVFRERQEDLVHSIECGVSRKAADCTPPRGVPVLKVSVMPDVLSIIAVFV
jgi:hypothetical protein